MTTYLALNTAFILLVMIASRRLLRRPTKRWWGMLAALLVMTAVFDSLIVGFGIVAYDSTKILGVYIGRAPIEDFFYAILAAIIVPTLWKRFTPAKVQSW